MGAGAMRYIMGFATHLGPWGTGTVKDTTGTTAGTIRNVGLSVLSQSTTISTTPGLEIVAVLPAGSQILNVYLNTTTIFNAATTLTLGDGTTANKYLTSTTITNVGLISTAGGNLVGTEINNIGTSDVVVGATLGGTATSGSVTVTVVYVQKASNGASAPASA
jgi:hypothetical protein